MVNGDLISKICQGGGESWRCVL